MLPALQVRAYRWLFASSIFWTWGRWGLFFLAAFHVNEITDSPRLVQLTGTAGWAPMLLGAMVGGVIADRYQRVVIVRCQLALMVPMLAWLASEDCSVNGKAFSAWCGRYARAFIGLSEGWLAPDAEPVSPDTIGANLEAIESRESYSVPEGIWDELRSIGRDEPARRAPEEKFERWPLRTLRPCRPAYTAAEWLRSRRDGGVGSVASRWPN